MNNDPTSTVQGGDVNVWLKNLLTTNPDSATDLGLHSVSVWFSTNDAPPNLRSRSKAAFDALSNRVVSVRPGLGPPSGKMAAIIALESFLRGNIGSTGWSSEDVDSINSMLQSTALIVW